jgi:cytochrome b561
MPLRNTLQRYGSLAQFFHWATVVLIVVQLVTINLAEDLPRGLAKLEMMARHKSFGITILMLATLRLAWRFANPIPPAPTDVAPWQRRAADVSHWLLYALIFALPLSGWLMSSAANYPVSWFGLVQLPDLVGASETLHETLEDVHESLATALLVIAGVHLLAALQHHFLRKDDVLRRMLPWGRRS